MAEKFDPAPHDKYAVGIKEAEKADRQTREDLRDGLIGTFPASDPVSATQPSKSKADEPHSPSLWSKIAGAFK